MGGKKFSDKKNHKSYDRMICGFWFSLFLFLHLKKPTYSKPAMSTILIFAVLPPTILIELLETPKNLASNFIKASLAWPSTGGAVSFTLYSPSEILTTSFFEERGETLIYIRIKLYYLTISEYPLLLFSTACLCLRIRRASARRSSILTSIKRTRKALAQIKIFLNNSTLRSVPK